MEDKYPLNMSQRGFSREGVVRAPSREGQTGTPEIRKKIVTTSQSGLRISGQNFYTPVPPKTQQDLGDDDLTIASVNLAADEKAWTSNMKVDLHQLQEEINKIDRDGKIRNMNPSNILKKNHLYAMAKFLSKYASQNSKSLIDKRMAFGSSADTSDILNMMGVKSESEGVRKLYKLLGTLDLMLVKLTEFQIVNYLNYDQIYEDLRKQLGGQPPAKTATMDSGISVSRFQVDFANVERLTELYSFVKKLQNKSAGNSRTKLDEGGDSGLKNLQSVDELYRTLRSGDTLGFNDDFIRSLQDLVERSAESKSKENNLNNKIKALEKEISEKSSSKLSTIVDFSATPRGEDSRQDLQKRIEQLTEEAASMRSELESQFKKEMSKKEGELKEKVRKLEYTVETKEDEIHKLKGEIEKAKSASPATTTATTTAAKDDVFNTEYYIKMIKQIEETYGVKAREAEDANHQKDQEIATLKTKLELAERERDDYLERLKELEYQQSRPRGKGDDNSFEAALREQFAAMKEGFENKIKSLMTEIQQLKKEKSIEILELKKDLNREKENRELLLRKLQIYTKT